MSRPLPPEIVDLVIDQLCDEPTTLRTCCLVSKSWVPRTRKHLFAHVKFDAASHPLKSWVKVFPDPSKSPAHYTRSLSIPRLLGIPTGIRLRRWIRAFRNVVHFDFDFDYCPGYNPIIAPFRGFSPTVRSLRVTSNSFKVFDFICSFPFLEDLTLINIFSEGYGRGRTPSKSPKLTGSLALSASGGISSATRQLLDFPGGLHFTKITTWCIGGDLRSVTDLVSECSNTLESLHVYCFQLVTSRRDFPDLSKASRLKRVKLVGEVLSFHWVIAALRTVKSENLQRITIHPRTSRRVGKDYQELQDLDRLLVQFWTSHSIRPRLIYSPTNEGFHMKKCASSWVPEMTRRGLIDLVKYSAP